MEQKRGDTLCSSLQFTSAGSPCPWDGVIWEAAGHRGVQKKKKLLTVSRGCVAAHSGELAAGFNKLVKVLACERKGRTDFGIRGSSTHSFTHLIFLL